MTVARTNPGVSVPDWPVRWGQVNASFIPEVPAPAALLSNVHAVPFLGDLCVLIHSGAGWGLPGGTIELGETLTDALRRELAEEIGGTVACADLLGHYRCRSTAETPYRPHIPHPDFAVAMLRCELRSLDGAKVRWGDLEGIDEIALLRPEDAIARLSETGAPETAYVCGLAVAMGPVTSGLALGTTGELAWP